MSNFYEVQFMYFFSFIACVLGVLLYATNAKFKVMKISPGSFISLALTFRSLIHFELIL
jgi:hypothetical protein